VTEPVTSTVDDANRLVQRGTTSFSYDANGNLRAETAPAGTTTYTWDARNRLRRIVTPNGQMTEFTYDFAGNLIRQADSGPLANTSRSYTLDVLTNVAFEQGSDGDHISILTAAEIDTHLATRGADAQVEFALSDAINSTVATVDERGGTKGRFDYEPFGQTKATGSTFPFRYAGRVFVSDVFYYFRARYYSAVPGKFVSEDPAGFATGDANLYRYVTNRPVSGMDPLGLMTDVYLATGGDYGSLGEDSDISSLGRHSSGDFDIPGRIPHGDYQGQWWAGQWADAWRQAERDRRQPSICPYPQRPLRNPYDEMWERFRECRADGGACTLEREEVHAPENERGRLPPPSRTWIP